MVCYLKSLFLVILSSILYKICQATDTETEPAYSTYVLEDICREKEEVIPVYLKGWSAAIVTLGQTGETEVYDREKHTCTLKVSTDKGFHIGGVVESIRIQGVQHPTTKRWECKDYIVFRSKGASILNQVLTYFLPDIIFKGRESEELCGDRSVDTSKIFRMVDKSSHSNVFTTMANSLEFEYHQKKDLKTPVNNSFTVVITTFRHIHEQECSGQVMCSSGGGTAVTTTEPLYCVHERYYCDGHVNCALPGGGSDERGCPGVEVAGGLSAYSVVFSSTIILFIALGSIVGAAILLVILYTLVARARGDSNRSSPSDSTTAVNFTASTEQTDEAPATHRTNRHHRRNNHHHRRGNRNNRHHHNRRDRERSREGEEEEEEEGRRDGRSRSRARNRRDENRRGEPRRQGGPATTTTRRTTSHHSFTTSFDPAMNPMQQEEKAQTPVIGTNQYNSFNRVNSLNSALNPSAPEIQPYPPSYDILFPTDG